MIKAMQQTQNLKLNLIETSDPLSPAPLNENASTLDAALADISQRVVSLENCRLVMGRYESGQKIIDLGERPLAVMVTGIGSENVRMGFVTGDNTTISQNSVDLQIVENGFQTGGHLYSSNAYYCYIAFLGGWDTKDFPKPKT